MTTDIKKPYRPEGWKNPYPKDGRAVPENIPWRILYEVFEAGADAILKALRDDALMYRHGDPATFSNGTSSINFDEGDRGYLVFIPED